MNKFFTSIVITSLSILSFNSVAQNKDNFSCGLNQRLEDLYKKNPELLKKYLKDQETSRQRLLSKGTGVDTIVYTIPLVFHIIHQNGSENITDAQVINQVNILNEDYSLKNSDTVDIVPAFFDKKAKAYIQFKLATKDPFGNCTNGIEHIYSHETYQGDDYSKLNQWDRSKYLNVWVVTKMGGGAAGYSFYPSTVDVDRFYADGVIILDNYIGDIGTSYPSHSTALTHEIGHWLNLKHTWGDNNNPEVSCGDDSVDDTPRTKGHLSCDLYDMNCTIGNLSTSNLFTDVTKVSGNIDTTDVSTGSTSINITNTKANNLSSNSNTIGVFEFSGWDTGSTNNETNYANLTGNINTTKYYEFKVKVDKEQALTIDNVSFNVNRDTNGIRTFSVRSDADNYASNISAVVTTGVSRISIQSGNVFFMKKDTTYTVSGCQINLTGNNLFKNITNDSVTFRIYGWNAENTNGTFGIDNLSVKGSYGVIENVQNYMEYSYCSNMYTPDQVARMREALTSITANRSNLITKQNHTATGIDVLSAPTCKPVAAFKSNKNYICLGSSILFTDMSWQASVSTRNWKFEDGTPATSSSASQTVTFNTPGFKKISLVVSNTAGADSIIRENYIYVSPSWADINGPATNDFEKNAQDYFIVENPENNWASFKKLPGVGYNKTTGYKLNNYKDVSNSMAYSEDSYYYDRLGGNTDALISSSYDLTKTSGVTVSFKYAYATNASLPDTNENVIIYSSTNCGQTWVKQKQLTTSELLTAGFAGAGTDFAPTTNNQWKTYSFNYTKSNADVQTRFKIQFKASDYSNNFYVDDFTIGGTLGLFTNEAEEIELSVYPNPTKSNQNINVSYHAGENPVEFTLRDLQGKIIHTETISTVNNDVNESLKITSQLNSACYFLEVKSGNFTTTKKIVVM